MAAAISSRAFTGRELVLKCGYHGWLQTMTTPECPRGLPPIGIFPGAISGLTRRRSRARATALPPSRSQAPTRISSRPCVHPALRELTEKHGALLIFDEIVMGFRLGGGRKATSVLPRSGRLCQGISNGMPLSCYLGRRDVMETVREAVVSSTFGGDTSPGAARAALRLPERGCDRPPWAGKAASRGCARSSTVRRACHRARPSAMRPAGLYHGRSGAQRRADASFRRRDPEARGMITGDNQLLHTEADIDEALGKMREALPARRGSFG